MKVHYFIIVCSSRRIYHPLVNPIRNFDTGIAMTRFFLEKIFSICSVSLLFKMPHFYWKEAIFSHSKVITDKSGWIVGNWNSIVNYKFIASSALSSKQQLKFAFPCVGFAVSALIDKLIGNKCYSVYEFIFPWCYLPLHAKLEQMARIPSGPPSLCDDTSLSLQLLAKIYLLALTENVLSVGIDAQAS